MMNWRKITKLSVGVFSASILVTGCGSSNSASPSSSGTSSAGPVEITFGTWGGASEDKQLQEIINKINNEHKNEFVIKELNVPSNYDQKLNTEFAAGNAPDIFYINDGNTPTYAQEGVLLDLTPYITKYAKTVTVANPDNYYQSSLVNDKYNGKYYALPWISQPVVMYYNPDMFKKAGLSEPQSGWTWDEFMKDAKALTSQKDDVYGYLQNNGWPPVEDYIWSYGGDMFNNDLSQSTVNSPDAIKGIDLMKRMVDEQVVPPISKLANVSIEDLFRQGKVAMFAGGAADGNYQAKGFSAKVAEMPMGTQHATQLYIADMGINAKTSKDKDVVFKAYTALLDAIDHWKILPPVKQYAEKIQDISVPDAPGGHTPTDRVQPILNSMNYARPVRVIKNMTKYSTIMTNDVYQPILLGQSNAADIANKTKTDLDAILK